MMICVIAFCNPSCLKAIKNELYMLCFLFFNTEILPYNLASFTIGSSSALSWYIWNIDTLKPRQNGRLFQMHFLEWKYNVCQFRLRFHRSFFPTFWIKNILALVQILAWRRPGDKPLSWPMMISLVDLNGLITCEPSCQLNPTDT